MTAAYGAAQAYKRQAVLTASKEKLIVLLYDAAIGELEKATNQLSDRKMIGPVGESLGKAFSIVSELKSSLNHEDGQEIATNLDQLYIFVQNCITRANQARIEEPLTQAIKVLRDLKEGWDGILA